MENVVYVCTGNCKAVISRDRYDKGLTKCGALGCNREGHTFEKRLKCTACGKIFSEGTNHKH